MSKPAVKTLKSRTLKSSANPLLASSSGLPLLDLILKGGYPTGSIVNLYGGRCSGKTTLLLHACEQAAKHGDTLFLGDGSLDLNYAAAIAKLLKPEHSKNSEEAYSKLTLAVRRNFSLVVLDEVEVDLSNLVLDQTTVLVASTTPLSLPGSLKIACQVDEPKVEPAVCKISLENAPSIQADLYEGIGFPCLPGFLDLAICIGLITVSKEGHMWGNVRIGTNRKAAIDWLALYGEARLLKAIQAATKSEGRPLPEPDVLFSKR